jgi:hypothetical protein
MSEGGSVREIGEGEDSNPYLLGKPGRDETSGDESRLFSAREKIKEPFTCCGC